MGCRVTTVAVHPPPESAEVRLVRIETKLDVVLSAHEDKEQRIRSLERRFWIALGFATASIAANIGGLATYLGGGLGP
jgi:hypothetical protein